MPTALSAPQCVDFKSQYMNFLPSQTSMNQPLYWNTSKLKVGSTFTDQMNDWGIPISDVYNMLRQTKLEKKLTNIRSNSLVEWALTMPDCTFDHGLIYLQANERIKIAYKADQLQATIEKLPSTKRYHFKQVTLTNSLFYDGQKAGFPFEILKLAESILSGHVNFATGLRKGDTLQLGYHTEYVNNRLFKHHKIEAMVFINRNKVWEVVRFIDENGKSSYHTLNGKNLETAFIRSPVDASNSRISSHFSKKRKHPITKEIRPHKGVDFAAPIGTAIHAAGDGIIKSIRFSPSYGRVMELKHGSRYETLYAHISKFARGMKEGKRVKKGQVIAYVGNTGLSTGPHLHYEFKVNGRHKNPLKVTFPNARSITKAQQDPFQVQMLERWQKLQASIPLLTGQGG